jgi:hypothetical protein
MKNEIVHIVNNSFALAASETDLIQLLADKINYLIVNDFNKLISILYRADVNEKKLNKILAENKNEDAGKLMALLFIERQMQKIKSREAHRNNTDDDSEEERW